jgi:hypothetical protein
LAATVWLAERVDGVGDAVPVAVGGHMRFPRFAGD